MNIVLSKITGQERKERQPEGGRGEKKAQTGGLLRAQSPYITRLWFFSRESTRISLSAPVGSLSFNLQVIYVWSSLNLFGSFSTGVSTDKEDERNLPFIFDPSLDSVIQKEWMEGQSSF